MAPVESSTARGHSLPLFHRIVSWCVALLAVGIVGFTTLFDPTAAYAQTVTVTPTAPVIPSSTVVGVGDVPYYTEAAATVSDAVVGSTAVEAVGAAATCGAVTLGTCAVAAAAVFGIAYGTYKLVHWAWGSSHVSPPPATGNSYTFANGYQVDWSKTTSGGVDTITATVHYPNTGTFPTYLQGWYSNSEGGTSDGYASTATNTVTINTAGQQGSVSFTGCTVSCGFGQNPTLSGACLTITNGSVTLLKTAWQSTGTCAGVVADPSGSTGTYPQTGTVVANPTHTLRINLTCHSTSGGPDQVVSYSTPSFDDTASAPPDLNVSNGCPAGTLPGGGSITETTSGKPDTGLATVPDPKLDPADPCSAVGASCRPTLQRTDGKTWFDEPTVQPSEQLSGEYRCEWLGPASVSPRADGGPLPMSDCVAAAVGTSTNTGTDTGSRPVDTTVDGAPGTGGDGQGCFPHGFAAFNPIEWVYKPVVCALQYAFIPTDAQLQGDLTSVQHAWDSSPPGVMLTASKKLTDPFVNMPTGDGSDCNGPDLAFDIPDQGTGLGAHHVDIHPWSMCNPVGQWVHGWVLPFVKALLYFATFFICLRVLGKTLGWESSADDSVGTDPVGV